MKITIERIEKTSNYTCVSNVYLREENLSLKAKGLLTLILSLPPEWDFSVEGIVTIVKEGRDAIQSTINELIKVGYCKRKQTNIKGVFSPFEYTFYESIPQQGFPSTVKPATVIPQAVNPIQLSTYKLNKEKRKKEKEVKIEAVVEGSITGISTSEKIETPQQQQQTAFENEIENQDLDSYWEYLKTSDLVNDNSLNNTNPYSTEESVLKQELDVEFQAPVNIQPAINTPQQQQQQFSSSSNTNTMATKEKVLIEFQKLYFDSDAEQITNKFIQIQGLNFNEKYIQERVEKWSAKEKRFIQKNAQQTSTPQQQAPIQQREYTRIEYFHICNQEGIYNKDVIERLIENKETIEFIKNLAINSTFEEKN